MPADLPRWPLTLLAIGFPILWVLGLGFLYVPTLGLAGAWVLLSRRALLLPPGWWLWFGYLVIAAASVVQIDSSGRLVGFLFRAVLVWGATAFALYVYTATPRSVSTLDLFRALSFVWVFLVVGGWLGVLSPQTVLPTPAASVFPGFLLDNDLVSAFVRPSFAEIQQPYGAAEPFYRPAAPMQGSNGWGFNVALLAPLVLAYVRSVSGWPRWVLIGFSVAAVVPAAATLNRGLLIGLGTAVAYYAFRAVLRGDFRLAFYAIGGAAAGAVVMWLTGVVDALVERVSVSETNQTRSALYEEAFVRTLDSPLLGYGAPRPSLSQDVSVGTQGHVWNILFAHGFIAIVCYVGFLRAAAWLGHNAAEPAFAAHVTVVVGSLLMVFYGLDGPQLVVLLTAAAVSVRDVRLRPWPHLFGDPRGTNREQGAQS